MSDLNAAFPTLEAAEEAVERLKRTGVPAHSITIQRPSDREDVPIVRVTGAHRIALYAGGGCAVAGMVVGIVVGLGILTHPLLGFLGPGPAAGALKGLIGGAGFGTLFGYILGMGLWEDDGELPAGREESVLVFVRDAVDGTEIRSVLEAAGATGIH